MASFRKSKPAPEKNISVENEDDKIKSLPKVEVKEKILEVPLSEVLEKQVEKTASDQDVRWRNPQNLRRYGFERLGHMHSSGVGIHFEEFQGRHPFDFVEETKEYHQYNPKFLGGNVPLEDVTVIEPRDWMAPVRKGQFFWDYCRDKWTDKESRLGAACAPIGCLYSLWEVTRTSKANGGVAFLIAYLIVTVLFAVPFVYMELAMGQFHRLGLLHTIRDSCPLFKGLGYLMLLSCALEYIMLMPRTTWLLYYLVDSFEQIPSWQFCGHDWNTPKCKTTLHYDFKTIDQYQKDERTPVVEYFRYLTNSEHLYSSDWKWGYSKPYYPSFGLLCCFACLIFIFREIMKVRCKRLGRGLLYAFSIAMFATAFCFVAKNYTTTEEILQPVFTALFDENNLDYLYNQNTWVAAIWHSVLGTGIGTGIHITFGSQNAFVNEDIKGQAFLTGLSSYFLHVVTVGFFSICYYTVETTKRFENYVGPKAPYGTDLIFEIFPQMLLEVPKGTEMWIMFHFMFIGLLLLGSMRIICVLYTIKQYFCDGNKEYYEPHITFYNAWEKQKAHRQRRYTYAKLAAKRKANVMTWFMVIVGIFPLTIFFQDGIKLLYLTETFWYKYMAVFILILETILVFFFLGMRTINDYIRKMTTWQVTIWFRFLWKFITPAFPFVSRVFHYSQLYMILYSPTQNAMNLEEITYTEEIIFSILCLVIMVINLFVVLILWYFAHGVTTWNKLVLKSTPIYDHRGLANGTKPAVRLHWAHHMCVPKGLRRSNDLQGAENPLEATEHHTILYMFLGFLWFGLRFKWLNSFSDECMDYYDYGLEEVNIFSVFPDPPFRFKEKKEEPPPEYIPNRQIPRIKRMRRIVFAEDRKNWLMKRYGIVIDGVQVDGDKPGEKVEQSSSSSDESHEGHYQLSDGESVDNSESQDWDHLSVDESDEDTMILLGFRKDSEDDLASDYDSVADSAMLDDGETLIDKYKEHKKELELEAKEKVAEEWEFEDIDDEQEMWEESDNVDDSDDYSESDITDEENNSSDSDKSHNYDSWLDEDIFADVIYTDSDQNEEAHQEGSAEGQPVITFPDLESWSECSTSGCSEGGSTPSTYTSGESILQGTKKRRVSFTYKTRRKQVAGAKAKRRKYSDTTGGDDDDAELKVPYKKKLHRKKSKLKALLKRRLKL